ncbi:MAG: hypothetical protein J5J06_20365 [Phycisphaerae bacterium]|nr:hypothetical protein [Phycisphaerae bacterium]
MRRIELLIGTMMGIAIGLGPVPAEAQTGACCNSGGSCTMTDEAGCSTSGTFLGAGTDCSGVDCSGVLGACCVGTGCIPDLSPS